MRLAKDHPPTAAEVFIKYNRDSVQVILEMVCNKFNISKDEFDPSWQAKSLFSYITDILVERGE